MLRVRTVVTGITGTPWYYNHFYGGTTSGEASVALAATKAWVSSISSNQSTGLTSQVQGDVVQINPTTGDITDVFAGASASYTSSNATARLPIVDQLLIRLRTGYYLNGREVRGRWFVPGLAASANTAGAVTASVITAVNGYNNTLMTSAAGAGDLVVYTRKNGVSVDVNSMPVWDQFAVMRSRRD